MNFSETAYFLSSLGLAEVTYALIALALAVGVKFLVKNKYKRLSSLAPIISGVAVSFVSSLIFKREVTFKDVMSEGMRTGSVATVLYVIICGFFKDDYVSIPFENLVIESMLSGYVGEEELEKVAGRCAEILCECLNGGKNSAGKKILRRGSLSKEEYEEALIKAEKALADYLEGAITVGGRVDAELISKTVINVFRATR